MLSVWAILLLGVSPASPADNDERWLLLVRADPNVPWGGSAGEEVRSVARHRIGMRVLSSEEAFVEGGVEAESALASCGADAACVAGRIKGAQVTHALLLVVRQVDRTVVIASRVIDAVSGQVVHQDLVEVAEGDAPLSAVASIARSSFGALGHRPGGYLLATCAPSECRIVVTDSTQVRPAASGDLIILPAGDYGVDASLEGYDPASAEVTLVEGETREVELVLQPSETITSSPWLWLVIGVVVAGIGLGVGAAVVGRDRCFCAAPDPGDCGSCP